VFGLPKINEIKFVLIRYLLDRSGVDMWVELNPVSVRDHSLIGRKND
jgi:hypothetical protein